MQVKSKKTKKALEGWTKTVLWFADGRPEIVADSHYETLEFPVWTPPDISPADHQEVLEKAASQVIDLIWKIRGTKSVIVQGQYKNASCTEKATTAGH